MRHSTSATGFFPDWVGDVAMQQDVTKGPRLEAFAGLDRGRWFVVGINVELGRAGEQDDRIFVDAVDMNAIHAQDDSGGFTEIVAFANRHGSLPVTRIELTGATTRDMLAYMTRGRITLLSNGITANIDVIAMRRHDVTVRVNPAD